MIWDKKAKYVFNYDNSRAQHNSTHYVERMRKNKSIINYELIIL